MFCSKQQAGEVMRCQLLLADESYRLGGLLQVNPASFSSGDGLGKFSSKPPKANSRR